MSSTAASTTSSIGSNSNVDQTTEKVVAKAMQTDKGRVFRVVLTGGPCGGKTTASTAITERLQNLGWRVFRVPEAANMLISGGMTFYNLTAEQQYTFQKALLKLMLQLEESFLDLAYSTTDKCIVIMDRGTMDCRAYMSEPEWQRMVLELGYNTVDLRDSRYDAVIHLVTAADGAEDFYTTDGHASRSEPADVARAIDSRIKGNWVGHPYFQVIDNRTSENRANDFNLKINKVMTTICKFMGIRELGVTKRKFLVRTKGPIAYPADIKHTSFHVEHDYLLSSAGTQSRLRRRGQDGHYSYSYTIRYPDLHGQRLELKRVLTRREYADLILTKDPSRQTIVKQRDSFLYKNQYWELDTFQSPQPELRLLEAYCNKSENLELPDFIDIEREITDDVAYSMYNLAYIPGAAATAADVIRQHRTSSATSNSPSIVSLTAPSSPQLSGVPESRKLNSGIQFSSNSNPSSLPPAYAATAKSTPSSPKSASRSS